MTYTKPLKLIIRSLLVFVLLISLLGLFVVLPIQPKTNPTSKLGVTYSIHAANALELDPEATFLAIRDELNPDIMRLPVYWDIIEQEEGKYTWEQIDFQLNALKNTDTKVILAIGHKLPRWPECHIPDWVDGTDIDNQLETLITSVVNRYKNNPNLYAWQIQNEVLFSFGECPEWSSDRGRLKNLIKLTKQLDPDNKVMTSDSGELSLWLRTSTLPIDALSVSLYRAVFGDNKEYFYWPVNPYYYKLHAALVKPFVSEFIISELQMEPWGPTPVQTLSLSEAYKSFSPFNFDERIDFAQRTGATTILSWGVEWWYYMKEVQDVPDYWDKAIIHFNK